MQLNDLLFKGEQVIKHVDAVLKLSAAMTGDNRYEAARKEFYREFGMVD